MANRELVPPSRSCVAGKLSSTGCPFADIPVSPPRPTPHGIGRSLMSSERRAEDVRSRCVTPTPRDGVSDNRYISFCSRERGLPLCTTGCTPTMGTNDPLSRDALPFTPLPPLFWFPSWLAACASSQPVLTELSGRVCVIHGYFVLCCIVCSSSDTNWSLKKVWSTATPIFALHSPADCLPPRLAVSGDRLSVATDQS